MSASSQMSEESYMALFVTLTEDERKVFQARVHELSAGKVIEAMHQALVEVAMARGGERA